MTEQTLSISAPVINHKYYGSLMFKSSDTFTYGSIQDSRFEWNYIDNNSNGRIIFVKKEIKTTQWQKLSSINQITTSTYLNQNWKIRNFQRGATEYSYCDDIIIVDLTATFGSGNEPDKAWCDKHINYFDGTATIYK